MCLRAWNSSCLMQKREEVFEMIVYNAQEEVGKYHTQSVNPVVSVQTR
jgi:hypothetical protein